MSLEIIATVKITFCPVCPAPLRKIIYEHVSAKRTGHAVGAQGHPVETTLDGVAETQEFECGLSRSRMHMRGQQGAWNYDDEAQCSNAQQVALELQARAAQKET